jgi:hypothetical protein
MPPTMSVAEDPRRVATSIVMLLPGAAVIRSRRKLADESGISSTRKELVLARST